MKSFEGKVVGKIYEVRFAFSGQVSWVGKSTGEKVTKGEHLASLDTKTLQTDLDRQLADYERIRAEFDTSKNIKTQSNLNVSVKDVETAKQKLDQVNLFSPVDGVIIESENLIAGLNVTPANSAIKILDLNSLSFVFQVNQDNLEKFFKSTKIKIKFNKPKVELEAQTSPVSYGQNGKFEVTVKIDKTENLIPGLTGEAIL